METKIIPTADNYLRRYTGKAIIGYGDISHLMIEFTKLHVQKALEEASENAEMKWVKYTDNDYEIDKDSILKSYPLNNIK
jgi:hypothetical protein